MLLLLLLTKVRHKLNLHNYQKHEYHQQLFVLLQAIKFVCVYVGSYLHTTITDDDDDTDTAFETETEDTRRELAKRYISAPSPRPRRSNTL